MRFRIFQFCLPHSDSVDDLNGFLASHRIVNVRQYFSSDAGSGRGDLLVFVVEYVDGPPTGSGKSREVRIDYREKLSPEDFAVFDRLRTFRKEIARRDGVPVYAIFTNAQLAEMVVTEVKDEVGLRCIEGVGTERVQKYGEQILDALRTAFAARKEDAS